MAGMVKIINNKDYDILIADRNTKREAEYRIKRRTYSIFTADDIRNEALDIAGLQEEYAEEIRGMLDTGIALQDWSICEYDGVTYYIEYEN